MIFTYVLSSNCTREKTLQLKTVLIQCPLGSPFLKWKQSDSLAIEQEEKEKNSTAHPRRELGEELHEGIRTKREALRPLGDKGFWYKEERSRYIFGSHNTDRVELSCRSPIVTPLWRSPFGAGQSHSPSQHTSQQTEPHLLCPTICYKPNASENSFRIGLLTKKKKRSGEGESRSLLHFIPTAPFPFPPPHTPICYIWKIFHNI